MLDHETRTAILTLRERGHGIRPIARTLGISRKAVREVLGAGTAEVPRLERAEKGEPFRDDILELHASCKGNLVRVHEELLARGAALSYQGLTAFCRRHGIGQEPKLPAGTYHFEPGSEMQHDTSPHPAKIGGVRRRVQSASLVLCCSHMIFVQLYPRFSRFECKVFLTDALRYFGGACAVCMIDNTHVVVLHGTGAAMVPVPEMAAFAERFSFRFAAHELGDKNRSGRVEAPMSFIENNFLAGREFQDFADANRQAIEWCDRVNARFNRRFHASRRELFATERSRLRPLPAWVPEVYELHQRVVDVEGYVNLHRNRYSVPYQLIGRQLEVRETKDRVEVYHGPRLVASHGRVLEPQDLRVAVPEHRPPRGQGRVKRGPTVAEQRLVKLEPALASYVAALKAHVRGSTVLALRRLLRMVRDYPRAPLLQAVETAAHYGLYDLDRLERMVLRGVAHEYFVLPLGRDDDEDDHDD